MDPNKYTDYSQYFDFKHGKLRIKSKNFNLYGCNGGTWEGAIFSMRYSHSAIEEVANNQFLDESILAPDAFDSTFRMLNNIERRR